MPYYVQMQQTDFFSFAHSFSDAEARAIRDAVIDEEFELSNGFGRLDKDGDVTLTFIKSDGSRMYDLNHIEICRQFAQGDRDGLEEEIED
ncbi:hypothetical protein [Janthinobacterium sp. NKUCC06_STL]|uniref:hypothetical protein n=1 Tax=Janthinobacterium sp. NKUCC06_STL TaxID=2842127 RepID=UPI001C5A7B99|nr:hypothetical protein [Janthinobacterium sp. NKUCC06_STL]MBW3512916.1 hypothetical protein [Janthinobacterium sp. NKUCC06_STL]